MYNNRSQQQEGVFTIRGDMCYDNKLMVGTNPVTQHSQETVYLNVGEQETENNSKKCKNRFRKYITPGRVLDLILLIIASSYAAFTEFGYVPHTRMGFYCGDPLISHLYTKDTISTLCLALVSLIVPAAVFLAVERTRADGGVNLRKLASWYWALVVAQLAFLLLCQTVKIVAGELRPHFLDTCAPDKADACTPGEYVTDYVCRNVRGYKEYLVTDSSKSFPSGHSGVAAVMSVFCALYIQLRFSYRQAGVVLKPFLITIILTWAPVTAVTRITDHRHHWWDTLAGLTLGVLFALYSVHCHCNRFRTTHKDVSVVTSCTTRPNVNSTTTLVDMKNKDATSVII